MTKIKLQPLRIPSDWTISWNTFFEIDPTPDTVATGFFGGSSLFAAYSNNLRLAIDLEWHPEDDPNGQYHLIVYYVPWPRTEKGRRRKGIPLDFRDSKVVHTLETRSREKIVSELEMVFEEGGKWRESN